jgi:hypothetical protein
MRRRRIIVKRRSRWTVDEWERGWALAMTRIHGVPAPVEEQPVFQDCLAVLNRAFADGNRLRFELGLGYLMNFCIEAVDQGACDRWWQ